MKEIADSGRGGGHSSTDLVCVQATEDTAHGRPDVGECALVLVRAPARVVWADALPVQAQRGRVVPKYEIVPYVEVAEAGAVRVQAHGELGEALPLATEGLPVTIFAQEWGADAQGFQVR